MASTKNDRALSKKEKAFCEEYIANGYNATQAYIKAYEVKYETAHCMGWKVLKRPCIKEYISQLQKEAFAAAAINAERVALRLADIAFAEKEDEVYTVSAQLKALDLLQKQLGLQHQKIEAEVNTDIVINIEE